jgi:membrane-bound lytic murein transglycosylase MltF
LSFKMLLVFCLSAGLGNVALSNQQTNIPLLSLEGINWTAQERAYIKALNQKGSIKIATKISKAVYFPTKDGSISGFHYSVLKAFSDLAKIKVDIKLVEWKDYFYKKGGDLNRVSTDPNYRYVPTLIENVDIYLDGITSLPWREKMFDIIKFVPSRQLIIARKKIVLNTISDLSGKNCAMVKHTSMEQNLLEIARAKNIKLTFIYAKNFEETEQLVSSGKADFTVFDSDRAFAALKRYDNLTIAWPISDVQIMGWAIHKKQKVLNNILQKYLNYAQHTGILDKYWFNHYGVTFIEYLRVMNIVGSSD